MPPPRIAEPLVGQVAEAEAERGPAPELIASSLMTARHVMITGGVRSGKSRYAELLLADEPAVTYLAPGPNGDSDPEWAARIAAHRLRRPASWTTVETADLAGALRAADQPVMIDCLGTWLTATIDRAGHLGRAAGGLAGRLRPPA